MIQNDSSVSSEPRGKGLEIQSRVFSKPFDLNQQAEEIPVVELPFSEDIQFEYVNLDLERLGKLKKTNFWMFLLENLKPHARFGEILNIDQLISYYPKYEEPLFPLKSKYHYFVEKIYSWVMKLIGESETPTKNPDAKFKKFITFALDNEECLRDEIYLLLIKLMRNNPKQDTLEKVWSLFSLCCGTFLPSGTFLPAVYNYLVSVSDNYPEERFKEWANYSLKRLYYLDKSKFKRNYPISSKEITSTKVC
jgi:hypothetical protein